MNPYIALGRGKDMAWGVLTAMATTAAAEVVRHAIEHVKAKAKERKDAKSAQKDVDQG